VENEWGPVSDRSPGCQAEGQGSVERETAANLTAQKNMYVIKQLWRAGGQKRDRETKIGTEGDRDRTKQTGLSGDKREIET